LAANGIRIEWRYDDRWLRTSNRRRVILNRCQTGLTVGAVVDMSSLSV